MKISSDALVVEVDPERGGEIVQVHAFGIPLLFKWEPRSAVGNDSASRWLARYRGGWQTIFPNGGEQSEGHEFHGSACLASYEHRASDSQIQMHARIDDYKIERTILVDGPALSVFETITCKESCDVMWSSHAALGAPLISSTCMIETNAREFLADAERDMPVGDLRPGSRSLWPSGVAKDGSAVDLRVLRDPGDRFGYLIDCSQATITNSALGIRIALEWAGFDHAWYWLEAHASEGFPWYRDAYVLGIEPASSYPGHGIASVRSSGGPLVHFEAGESKSVLVTVRAEQTIRR